MNFSVFWDTRERFSSPPLSLSLSLIDLYSLTGGVLIPRPLIYYHILVRFPRHVLTICVLYRTRKTEGVIRRIQFAEVIILSTGLYNVGHVKVVIPPYMRLCNVKVASWIIARTFKLDVLIKSPDIGYRVL